MHVGTLFQRDTAPSLKAVGVLRTTRNTFAFIEEMLTSHAGTIVVCSSTASQALRMAAITLVRTR